MKEYMQMLIWIMLFVIIIEMLFPDSNYKKYMKLVLGCIIVYTMMKPIVRFIPVHGKNYDDYVVVYQEKLAEGDTYSHLEEAYKEQMNRQQSLLKDTFNESIKAMIEKELDVSVISAETEWAGHEESMQIEKIYLMIGDKQSDKKNKITIPKVNIGEKSNSLGGDEEKLKIKIKTCLKNFYNVQSRNIYITVQKN